MIPSIVRDKRVPVLKVGFGSLLAASGFRRCGPAPGALRECFGSGENRLAGPGDWKGRNRGSSDSARDSGTLRFCGWPGVSRVLRDEG